MATSSLCGPMLEWMRGVALGGLLRSYVVLTEPKPKNVPQATRYGGVYYSKGFTACYAVCQKQLATQRPPEPPTGRLVVNLETVASKPKTGKLAVPRGDVDNFAKGALDAGTKAGLWGDDDQIVLCTTSKRYAGPGEAPGFYMHVAELPHS